ncbi:MAG: glycosyltransferase family 2 protein, partial [Prevotellaceae bacterium]|nr:glycosyltransferase family 2 protein [Prevotellaceae bacterium]
LNRMRLGTVSLERGCANFDRLEATPRQQRIMAEAYAAARGFDAETVFHLIVEARNRKKNAR